MSKKCNKFWKMKNRLKNTEIKTIERHHLNLIKMNRDRSQRE